jgi:L-asparaginase II
MPYLPVLELTRGNIVESLHHGAIAVADVTGRLVASYGDPRTVTFLRSSAKPFQAISLVESGAADAFGLTLREIALACASHKGLDMHAEAAAAMQQKIGVSESDLLCGTHPLEDPETAARLLREGRAPTPNRHNCSGKHTGMLAQARHRGLPLADYVNPQHGVQQTILKNFAEVCGLDAASVVVGVDGCSAPNFAVPLVAAATAFARLADPAARSVPAPRAAALKTIFSAMTTHPEMVRGPKGFDTELMRARPGVIVSKGGAEGYQGIGIAAGALGPGSPALGVALKIADGASRAVAPVALEVLRQVGALGELELQALESSGFGSRLPLNNWRGLAVGEARTCFELTSDSRL